MKQHILIFIFILSGMFTFAGNDMNEKDKTTLISGKVIDKISGEEIVGAEIKVDDKIIYTDLNGNFSASININKTEAIVKYISYNDTKIKIDPYSYNTILIELTSK